MKTLTGKQEQFALAYLETGNRVEAYKRAYNCAAMTQKTVRRKAQEVAALPIVAARIQELQDAAAERSSITADRVIQELARLAFSSLPGIVDLKGGVLSAEDWRNLSPAQRACIKSAKPVGESIQITLHDKNRALDSLSRHLGLFDDKAGVNEPGVHFKIDLRRPSERQEGQLTTTCQSG